LSPLTLFLDIIELEAKLEKMERCVEALREPLKDLNETIVDLRSKRNSPASSSSKRKEDLPVAGSQV
jgi:hypothetical protein